MPPCLLFAMLIQGLGIQSGTSLSEKFDESWKTISPRDLSSIAIASLHTGHSELGECQ